MNDKDQLEFLRKQLEIAKEDAATLKQKIADATDAWIANAFLDIAEAKVDRLQVMIRGLELRSKGLESY